MAWTRFMDMHSGGDRKLSHEIILIEAPKEEAELVFYNRFKRNPYRITCICCGEDYNVQEHPTLLHATGFDRGCDYVYYDENGTEFSNDAWYTLPVEKRRALRGGYVDRPASGRLSFKPYQTLDAYLATGEALVIYADQIAPSERTGTLPKQGFVWVGDEDDML